MPLRLLGSSDCFGASVARACLAGSDQMSRQQLKALMDRMNQEPCLHQDVLESGLDPIQWSVEQGYVIKREDIELEDYRRKRLGGQNLLPWRLFSQFCW